MYNYIYIYIPPRYTYMYIYTMHAYIHIYSIHVHIYMHIYTCTHCMVTTTPSAAYTPPPIINHTHCTMHIHMQFTYTHTHTHTISLLIHTHCTKPQNHYNSLALTGHQPRCVGPVLALHQHHLSMQAQTGMIAG